VRRQRFLEGNPLIFLCKSASKVEYSGERHTVEQDCSSWDNKILDVGQVAVRPSSVSRWATCCTENVFHTRESPMS
jgi:hypothetical protein